ncbi:MAG TPA: hypothetical protein VGJ84_09315 [Polyangiaceae bacterium]
MRIIESISAGVLLAGAVVGLSGGCGGSAESTSPDASTANCPAAADVARLYVDAICSSFTKCDGAVANLFLSFLGAADCASFFQNRIEGELPLDMLVSSGKVVYNCSKLQACLDALSAGCGALDNARETACEAAIAGQVADGQSCDYDLECKTGSFCDAQTSCPGTCKMRRVAGDPCSYDSDCTWGLKCSADSNHCVAPAKLSEPCGGGVAPECASGLFCAGDSMGTPGSCSDINTVFSARDGQACSFSDTSPQYCIATLSCAVTGLGPTGAVTGAQCKAPVGANATCQIAFPDMCPISQYCKVPGGGFNGTCVDRPALGQPCTAFGLCEPGLVCIPSAINPTQGNCELQQKLGSPCQGDANCYSGRCYRGACVRADACM